MTINYKINVKTVAGIIVIISLPLFLMQIKGWSRNKKAYLSALTSPSDTTPRRKNRVNIAIKDSSKAKDTSVLAKDSLKNTVDTLTISKDSLDAPVNYTAKDSGVLIVPTKEFILYSNANMKYKDMVLDANTIRYDQQSQLIKAFGGTDDSTKNALNKPQFVQGDMKSISDSINFSMKTMKGLTKNTFFQQDELYVNAQVLKKESKDVFYAKGALLTTCNLDTPHFAFRSNKIKMINNQFAFSGPASPEFEGVPIPIAIPFGIFPLVKGRHSGLLPPQFTSNDAYGFGLEGLGFYKVINDNWDVILRSNIYAYGGWTVNINPKYMKRYHYTGAFNMTLQRTRSLNTGYTIGKDEFTTSKTFMINWSHNTDNRARPGTSFAANVNFGSTRYNQLVANNPVMNFNNSLSSSISYSKDFHGKANLSLNLNHNQNNNTHLVSLSLPNASFNMVTRYPFQKKDKVGTPKWYESFGIGYSGNFQNQFSFYDTANNTFKKLLDTAQWGISHNIPITLTLPQLGPVTLGPSISYQEHWLAQKIIRTWDSARHRIDTNVYRGLYTTRQMSFGISANTRIFGTLKFKNSAIKAIRHEMRPTLGLSYTPDMSSKYYYQIQVDTLGHKQWFSQFDGVVPGGFGQGNSGSVSFGIDNLLEMKVKDKKDTSAAGVKKIKLIDGFGFNSSYNLLADSFALSNINMYMRSTLFEKINITANATLDPYAIDKWGYRKDSLMITGGKLGRITNASVAISTSFKSKSKDPKADKDRLPVDPFMTPDEQQRQLQFARSNPAEFTDFNIPWSVNLSYSLSYNKSVRADSSGAYSYYSTITSSVNFSGDFSLTAKWKMGGNGYFDFNTGKLQQFSLFVTREMHCWQLAVNVTPIGLYKTFSITINPKSGILRDLKINRSRTYSNYSY